MTDTAEQGQQDQGAAQQAADLSQLEFVAANEDYTPGPEIAAGEVEAAADPEAMDTGEMMTSLLQIGFGLVASRRGDHWALNEAEATETGNAIGGVLDKYFPDLSNQGVEVTAVMTCAMLLTPRLMTDKQLAAQREQQAEVRQGQGGHETVGPAPQPSGEKADEGVELHGD